jgi:hypothetical protein
MSFVLRSKRYTVAYLDHPKNPKEARYSEREYGRFGSYFGYTLEKDKPLSVNYRLWLQEGLMKPEEISVLSTSFVEPVEEEVLTRFDRISKPNPSSPVEIRTKTHWLTAPLRKPLDLGHFERGAFWLRSA